MNHTIKADASVINLALIVGLQSSRHPSIRLPRSLEAAGSAVG
jgi:hypothetical protein